MSCDLHTCKNCRSGRCRYMFAANSEQLDSAAMETTKKTREIVVERSRGS